MFGLDTILSKSFGVSGVVNIAPTWHIRLSGSFPAVRFWTDSGDYTDSPRGDFVFNEETQVAHRFTIEVDLSWGCST